ncbi:uncharacterized protein LOC113504307 [Trichoplusia ni]|uniref:Uncharacterized protein LOC113504307 n=1 Tax=Trichoplusia ni TaxID=7111 RepID=A0A7E5WNP3_TRINI|nr:uncharacterized protein LOC113504307 [Trichoplusia ni]
MLLELWIDTLCGTVLKCLRSVGRGLGNLGHVLCLITMLSRHRVLEASSRFPNSFLIFASNFDFEMLCDYCQYRRRAGLPLPPLPIEEDQTFNYRLPNPTRSNSNMAPATPQPLSVDGLDIPTPPLSPFNAQRKLIKGPCPVPCKLPSNNCQFHKKSTKRNIATVGVPPSLLPPAGRAAQRSRSYIAFPG